MNDNSKFQNYLDELSSTPQLLTDEEERQLAEAISRGDDDQAIVRLTVPNLRYVVSVAKGYIGQGVPFEDLVSEGNVGMMKAAQKFKPDSGKRFVAFAAPFVRQAIEQAISEQAALYQIPKHEQTAAERKRSHAVSIDAPIPVGSQNNYNLLSIIENSDTPHADQQLEQHTVTQLLLEAASVLNERERFIITACYGIGCERHTMAEVAEQMGLKRERVRQIRNKALRKLRQQARQHLKELK